MSDSIMILILRVASRVILVSMVHMSVSASEANLVHKNLTEMSIDEIKILSMVFTPRERFKVFRNSRQIASKTLNGILETLKK